LIKVIAANSWAQASPIVIVIFVETAYVNKYLAENCIQLATNDGML